MECVLANVSAADIIVSLAFLVASLSALYARKAATEAENANLLNSLPLKNEIFDAFFALKMHMTQKSQFCEAVEVAKFYYPQRNARKYLPSNLADDIEKYFDACFWAADIHRRQNGSSSESMSESQKHLDIEATLGQTIEVDFGKLFEQAKIKKSWLL